MKNYFKLTEEKKELFGHVLFRIEATIDLPVHGVKKGDKGGWVEKESNISGNAWVSGDARVSGDAHVYGDASVSGDAHIDSISAIIVVCIALKHSITITRKYIFIGCKQFTRKEALKITKKKAQELGLEKEYYTAYKTIVKGALLLVKENA